MSQKILLQTLLRFSEGIKSGTAKVQDVVNEYIKQTGKSPTDEENAFILNEFAKNAPDNVTNIPTGGAKSETLFVDKLKQQNPDVEIRGDETFGELIEKLGPAKEEGIGSIFPKGKGAAFEKIDDRDEVAEFVRNMRKEGISNPDIRGVFKEFGTDIEGGKRAATTLARAADMGADTKVKQELLSELDEMKMDKGPRFFQEEYMGFDDFKSAVDAKKIEVNNAIVDDLTAKGVSDEDVMFIMGRAREINKKPFYTSGEEFVDIIKDELEFRDIDYDVEFYKKYFEELESLMRKPPSRFLFGGAV